MKCDHEACGCIVEDGGFCDVRCREAATEAGVVAPETGASSLPMMDCGCGHAECIAAQVPRAL